METGPKNNIPPHLFSNKPVKQGWCDRYVERFDEMAFIAIMYMVLKKKPYRKYIQKQKVQN